MFLFSENYLSTIFYSDIIETVIYSDYICCKCSPYSTRFKWQYNPRHDCVAFKIHLQADNHSFLTTAVRGYNRKFNICYQSKQEYRCTSEIDDVTVRSLIAPSVYNRWKRRQLEDKLETSGQWKWCPNNKCHNIASVYESGILSKFGNVNVENWITN